MDNFEDRDTVPLRIDYEKRFCSNNCGTNTRGIHIGSQKDTSTRKVAKILNPWASYSRLWNKIFLASCVIGVSIDPLFLYIPIINGDKKCLDMDEHVKKVALVLRTITDFAYVLHIIFRLRSALTMAKELGLSISTGFPWSYLLIDVLAILPFPQVIVLVYFSKLAGSGSLTARKVLNSLLLLQYVPRLLRVYFSAKELGSAFDSLTRRLWVRGAFLFFLYVIFAHVFGGLWYFYSIFRETACWHHACRNWKECIIPRPFDCRGNLPMENSTYLEKLCPVNPQKKDVFNFGIFEDAVNKKSFLKKYCHSFWWGLRNLSSFGQNLETSSNLQENLFAILISMLGLLLFLYLIGNLQTYMQLSTTKSEEARQKIIMKQPEIESYLSNHDLPPHKKKVIMRYLQRTIREDRDFDVKHLFSLLEEHSDHSLQRSESFSAWVTKILDEKKRKKNTTEQKAELWISKNGIPCDLKPKIMRYVLLRLQEGKDVDLGHILSILPLAIRISLKKHLCVPVLKKVPMLEDMDDGVLETICNYLKPVTFSEKSYILRKKEPLDFMLFITQGVVWSFGGNSTSGPLMERLEKGDYYGKELIEWKLRSTSYSEFPISTFNLKCHIKVEAFALMLVDLEHALSTFWWKFSHPTNSRSISEGLKLFAIVCLQRRFRRFIRNKRGHRKYAASA